LAFKPRQLRKLGYGELLDRTSERGLPLPRVSEEVADRMADTVVQLLDLARP
jgi:hypothetical protein